MPRAMQHDVDSSTVVGHELRKRTGESCSSHNSRILFELSKNIVPVNEGHKET